MLDVRHLDLEEIATALQDLSAYEYRWLIDPASGEIVMWTADGGIDGKTSVDLDELDLIPIDALPSFVWHRDMADFAERISDEQASRRLQRAIQGRGASGGSRMKCMRSIRTCCQPGTPSSTPGRPAGPSTGFSTTLKAFLLSRLTIHHVRPYC